MEASDLLRQAIDAARSGREMTARNLFQDVVRVDPDNEVAWMWLSGLLDPLEDRIMACERVLSINPDNRGIRNYLQDLHAQQADAQKLILSRLDEKVQQVRWLVEDGKKEEALLRLQTILRNERGLKDAWQLFADLSVNVRDKVRAYEAIVELEPSNLEARENLKKYRYYQNRPMELAALYEEEGELEKALELYQVLAAEAGDSSAFEAVYKHILRIEGIQLQNIRHVRPSLHILRFSVGLPLLYILEVLMQEGLNPVRHPAPDLWLGIPIVILGSFLISVAAVPSRHALWQKWFGEPGGRGTSASRWMTSFMGWMLVLIPHLLLVADSVLRLRTFETPSIPWFG